MPSVILATAGYDHTIRFWEAPTGTCYRTIQLTPDSRRRSVVEERRFDWEMEPNRVKQINALQITPDKQYIAAAGNPVVRLYEAATSNPSAVTSFDGHTGNVTSLGFHKDGKWMYTGSEDGTVKIWDLRGHHAIDQSHWLGGIRPDMIAARLVANMELVSGQQNGSVRIWNLSKNTCSRELVPSGEVAIRSVDIAPNGSTAVAANNDGTVYVWRMSGPDTNAFDPVQRLEAHKTYLLRARISPNSQLLATTSADKTIKIWSLNKSSSQFTHVKTLTGHTKWVWDCVFSSDCVYLVSAASDQTARLWYLQQGDSVRHYTGHHKAITSVALADT